MRANAPIIFATVMIGVATLLAQTTPSDQKSGEALESRIKALEEKVAKLEKLNTRTILGQGSVIIVTNSAPSPSFELHPAPNPLWSPFEFNNETFYYIPLSDAGENVSAGLKMR